MKKIVSIKTLITGLVIVALFIGMHICGTYYSRDDYTPKGETVIELCGEAHGVQKLYDAELAEWKRFYDKGCRDLYVELPYYEGQLLNLYMQAENDEILYVIYDELEGTASHTEFFLNFYKAIKAQMPETVFHGTDLGHQYFSLGPIYLSILEKESLSECEEYKRAQEVMAQGQAWYEEYNCDWEYREKTMIDNFIWDYNKLTEKALENGNLVMDETGKLPLVMGIYGGAHTNFGDSQIMAAGIKACYGDLVACKFVSNMVIEKKAYDLGFSVMGLVFLLLLFIPNIIFGITITDEVKASMQEENKILLFMERVGEALVTVSLVIFPAINPRLLYKRNICLFWANRFEWFVLAMIFMAIYEAYWIRYFISKKTVNDFYYSMLGMPLSGASLPCAAVIALSIYSGNLVILAAGLFLSIGHIGIHYTNYRRCK